MNKPKEDPSECTIHLNDNKLNEDVVPEGYMRVTECLKPFSKMDLIDPEILNNAADRGSRVHKFCELYANNMLFEDIDEDCKNYVEVFKRWFDQRVEKVIFSEKRINNDSLKLSGCIDLAVFLKDSEFPCIVDIKTSASQSMTWPLQTAAYRMLLLMEKKLLPVANVDRMVLMLPKNGRKAKEVEHFNHQKDTNIYMKCLEIYRYFNE